MMDNPGKNISLALFLYYHQDTCQIIDQSYHFGRWASIRGVRLFCIQLYHHLIEEKKGYPYILTWGGIYGISWVLSSETEDRRFV